MSIWTLTLLACGVDSTGRHSLNPTDKDSGQDSGQDSGTIPTTDTGCDPSQMEEFSTDWDGDGYGAHDAPGVDVITACVAPEGYAPINQDCDDSRADIHIDAEESCGDGLDNNCDDITDSGCALAKVNCPDHEAFQSLEQAYLAVKDSLEPIKSIEICGGDIPLGSDFFIEDPIQLEIFSSSGRADVSGSENALRVLIDESYTSSDTSLTLSALNFSGVLLNVRNATVNVSDSRFTNIDDSNNQPLGAGLVFESSVVEFDDVEADHILKRAISVTDTEMSIVNSDIHDNNHPQWSEGHALLVQGASDIFVSGTHFSNHMQSSAGAIYTGIPSGGSIIVHVEGGSSFTANAADMGMDNSGPNRLFDYDDFPGQMTCTATNSEDANCL